MPYAEDLLDVARGIADMDVESPRQASLRRAVSTAYYALFHLLISEATSNWNRVELRPALGRIFEHGKMKKASEVRVSALKTFLKKMPAGSSGSAVAASLLAVADAFLQAHRQREDADYNTSREWTRSEVWTLINLIAIAFESWKTIRDEPEAQAYLVSLLDKQGR
jgi:uncharacterized protein (UPF0332 family)